MVITYYLITPISIGLLCAIMGYYVIKDAKTQYQLLKTTEDEYQRAYSILSFLLPDFVKARVKDGTTYIAEDKGTVSIIFCDICDFDKITNDYSPDELISFLD
jgi:hypothetical protein|mmetsp:Transcript_35431/g.6386  ORF Transcript_35431/g.6386 Transcript_35431/m.6386 type:complete len:103 (+) Transcript_35431:95-403(+)